MQIVTVCSAVKIQEQQPGRCSALGGLCQAGTPHPVSSLGRKPIPTTFHPLHGQHKVFSKLKVFPEPARPPTQGAAAGLCTASAPRQVEVLPRERQELFLGKPWPLPSGTGGKEPLT